MKITLHRPHQIGGCITEIVSSKGTRIFVDLGHNLPKGDQESEDEYASEKAIADLIGDAKAIFYTHMHGDHVELFQYVPDGINQYIGPLALKIMRAKYDHMSHADELKENSLKCLKKLESFKTYWKGRPIFIDDITVTPFQVSHSSADSYMLKIKCDGKTILHTGDFRGHGYMGEGIYKVIDKYHIAGHVYILITEGTNVDNNGKSMRPESILKEEFKDVFRQYKNTFILCSSTDADRLESIYSANKESVRRPFIVDTYQKEIIGLIAQQAEEGRRLYHFGPYKIYGYDPKVEKMDYMMRRHGFVMLIRRSEKFQSYLDKILPNCKPEETCLVYSQFHGYIDKREDNTAFNQDLYDFVDQFRKKGFIIKDDLHTSGHASKQDLVRLCEQVNPQVIVPIHKDENADFASILPQALQRRVCEYEYSKDEVDIYFDPPQRNHASCWCEAMGGNGQRIPTLQSSKEMNKLIFLDIDGVLDTYKSRYQLDPELMAHLGTLLEKTGASIVISSSWRAQDIPGTVEFMTDPDNPSVGGHPFPFTDKIVGVTPILFSVIDGDIDRPATRGEEIAAYLKAHPCDNYVILDDCDEMLRDQWTHLVLVNDEVGLTEVDVEKAVGILNQT